MKRIGYLFGCTLLMCATAHANDKVNFRLDWVYGAEHAAIFVAKDKGFFAKEGIDVTVLPGQGSTVTIKLVGNRDVPFGFASADQVLMAAGRGLPVVATAVMFQKSPSAVIFPKASGINSLKDLYGKRLGIPTKSTVEKQWRAVAKLNGIDTKKIREVALGPGIVPLIENHSLDAEIGFSYNDGLKLVADGIPTSWILFSDVGLQMYSESLVTNAALIKENPDLVHRFTRAFLKGWAYTEAHPDEALHIFLKDNPTVDAKYSKLKLPEVLKLIRSEDTNKNGLGFSTKEKWAAMQKALIGMGLMEKPIDVSNVFSNQFIH